MLKRQTPAVIPTTITLKGQGETVSFDVTFHNRDAEEFDAFVDTKGRKLGEIVLYVIESWDTEYPLTLDGVRQAEGARPGLITALMQAYHGSRQVALEKN